MPSTNSGMPQLAFEITTVPGSTFFEISLMVANRSGAPIPQLAMNSGAKIIGGCCGTSFDHVRAMRKAMDQHSVSQPPTLKEIEEKVGTMSEGSRSIFQGDDSKPTKQRRSRRSRV